MQRAQWLDNSYKTTPHYKPTNPRVTVTSTENTSSLLKSTWKVPVIGRWKQASIWQFKVSLHWPLKVNQKAANIGRWKQASIGRRKHSNLIQLHQVAISSRSSGWKNSLQRPLKELSVLLSLVNTNWKIIPQFRNNCHEA